MEAGMTGGLLLPNSRLVSIDDAAHAPWIEAPTQVFGAITIFLAGVWPETAYKVRSLEPNIDPQTATEDHA